MGSLGSNDLESREPDASEVCSMRAYKLDFPVSSALRELHTWDATKPHGFRNAGNARCVP